MILKDYTIVATAEQKPVLMNENQVSKQKKRTSAVEHSHAKMNRNW